MDGNDSWIVEAGADVVEKKAAEGIGALSPLERVIYSLWVADYGMRNAGDLTTAGDLHPSYLDEARRFAAGLELPATQAAFGLEAPQLEQRYFELFDQIGDELRQLWRG